VKKPLIILLTLVVIASSLPAFPTMSDPIRLPETPKNGIVQVYGPIPDELLKQYNTADKFRAWLENQAIFIIKGGYVIFLPGSKYIIICTDQTNMDILDAFLF